MGKMPDKVNQLPAVLAAPMLTATGKRRHTRKSHAILDDPEKLAVAKILRLPQTQVRWLGVEAIADHSLSAPIVSMTDGAMIREVKPRVAHVLCRGKHRILRQPRTRRDRHVARWRRWSLAKRATWRSLRVRGWR